VKLGFQDDVSKVRLLRSHYPDATIRLDINQGWELPEAKRKILELEGLNIDIIEEPIYGSWNEIEQLAAASTIPIILDETVTGIEALHTCLDKAPSVSGIVVKMAKSGGPDLTRDLITSARDSGLKVMMSSMIESSLGTAAAAHLASGCDWCDLDAPLLLSSDPFCGLEYRNDSITAPSSPGIGISPSADFMKAVDRQPAVFP
jgi:L-alanine-DL-glutamate epimerase-like enolase superfamily enzyme